MQQKLLNQVLQFFKKYELEKPTVLLGLSGGADSVSLFLILQKMHADGLLKLVCIHVNHGWREESSLDQEFCQSLADKFEIQIIIKNAGETNLKNNGSLEELGRNIRRKFFLEVQKELDANLICLAHHFDDQIETFFIKGIRGTSLQGLGGIREFVDPFYRPLLNIRKSEIIGFLKDQGQSFVQDESNQSDDFLRNRIRKYLVPQLEKVDSRSLSKISDSMAVLREEHQLLEYLVQQKFEEIKLDDGVDRTLFLKQPVLLQKNLLVKLLRSAKVNFNESQAFFNELIRFLYHPGSGSHSFSTWYICKNRKVIFVNLKFSS